MEGLHRIAFEDSAGGARRRSPRRWRRAHPPRGQRRRHNEFVGRDTRRRLDIAKRQFVLGQRARLVAAQHVHARHLFDRDEARDDRLEGREALGADRHRDGKNRRQRHRDRGDGEDQRELKSFEQRIAAEERGDPNDENKATVTR